MPKPAQILPSQEWCRWNGYAGLYTAMSKRPDLFAHIQPIQTKRTLQQMVLFAEELAEQFGGIPSHGTLRRQYNALHLAIKRHPKRFAHIPQLASSYTPAPIGFGAKNWEPTARKLIKRFKKWPATRWLQANGFGGLVKRRQRQPELFQHLGTW